MLGHRLPNPRAGGEAGRKGPSDGVALTVGQALDQLPFVL